MRWTAMTLVMILLGSSAAATAQQERSPELRAAQAALEECLRLVEGPQDAGARRDEGRAAAEKAEKAFRAAVAAEPTNADAHAGLGEAVSRCGVPYAGMATIMGVVESSIRALEKALELEPTHWQARFILGMNYFHMPSFLNRNADAIRELETLVGQQGERADAPHLALPYVYLGDAYKRAGRRADAQATYAAGAKLFPDNVELQQRAAEGGTGEASVSSSGQGGEARQLPSPVARDQRPTVYALAPLRVEAGQQQLEDARSSASLRRLDIYMMPGGTGEMLQTLQALPGATRAGDGADLFVRGGEAEETPVFVNGGRIAFPGRWESLNGSTMGVLDATMLSKAYFSAGGFSAKYGNALSGIVDVESRGRPTAGSWRVGANMVSAGASVYQPIGESAGSWGTVTLTDVTLVSRMQGSSSLYPDMPRSYQAVGGANFKPGATTELKAVALAAADESSRIVDVGAYHGAFSSNGNTQHGGLSGRWLRADGRAGVSASVTASRRDGGFRFGVLERERTDEAFGARVDGDIVLAAGTRVRGGVEATEFGARTSGSVPLTQNLSPGSPSMELRGERATEAHVGGYVEVEHALSGSLVGVAGVRADRLPGESEASLDPRVALAYISRDWTLRAGGGVFHQGRWRRLYRLPDGGAPSGVPTRARHVIVGAERDGDPAIRVDAYAKVYDDYAAGEGGGPAIARGLARGVDAMVRWQRESRLNGWVTYSLLDAEVTLDDDRTVNARYDVTHSLTGVARLALSDAWELGSTLRLATGKPYTPVVGTQPPELEGWPIEPVYGAVNGERLPYYGRLDGRITRFQSIGGGMGVFYLEMLDLTGRRNVMGFQYDATYSKRQPVESFFARRTFVLGAELQF